MNIKRKITILILLGTVMLLGLVAIEVFLGPRGFLPGFDRSMHASYTKVSKGETKSSVFNALGEPEAKSEAFNLPQRQGFEHLFEAAAKSPAVEYYQWINGMNWYYCIGFDLNGVVVVKGEGHS